MRSRVVLRTRALISRSLAAAAFIGLLSGLASCSHTTSPATSGSVSWTTPGKGTVFIYETTGTMTEPAQQTLPVTYDTETVSATGLQYPTVANVYELTNSTGGTLVGTTSNGDALIGDPSTTPVSWMRYPLTGNTAITDPVIDSTSTDGTHVHQTSTRAAIGTESFTFAGKNYTSYHVRETDHMIQYNAMISAGDTVSSVIDIWFVPALGAYSRISQSYNEHAYDPSNGYQGNVYTFDTRLSSYQPH